MLKGLDCTAAKLRTTISGSQCSVSSLAFCASAQPDGPALDRAPLVLAQAAPDAGILAGVDRPAQALVRDRAAAAHLLGFLNLEERGTAVSDREEQLWINLTAGGDVAPVHDVPFRA